MACYIRPLVRVMKMAENFNNDKSKVSELEKRLLRVEKKLKKMNESEYNNLAVDSSASFSDSQMRLFKDRQSNNIWNSSIVNLIFLIFSLCSPLFWTRKIYSFIKN